MQNYLRQALQIVGGTMLGIYLIGAQTQYKSHGIISSGTVISQTKKLYSKVGELASGSLRDESYTECHQGYALKLNSFTSSIDHLPVSEIESIQIFSEHGQLRVISKDEKAILSIQLIDISGRIIMHQNGVNNTSVLSVPSSCRGIYILRIICKDHRTYQNKIFIS